MKFLAKPGCERPIEPDDHIVVFFYDRLGRLRCYAQARDISCYTAPSAGCLTFTVDDAITYMVPLHGDPGPGGRHGNKRSAAVSWLKTSAAGGPPEIIDFILNPRELFNSGTYRYFNIAYSSMPKVCGTCLHFSAHEDFRPGDQGQCELPLPFVPVPFLPGSQVPDANQEIPLYDGSAKFFMDTCSHHAFPIRSALPAHGRMNMPAAI
jgi:hypothetical protein